MFDFWSFLIRERKYYRRFLVQIIHVEPEGTPSKANPL
jgi:hypothetical protein